MGFSFSSALGGAASIGGSLIGAWSQSNANRSNRSIADASNAMSLYMSNTSHQREVADLKAAGLNPILSATGGSGASVPSMSNAYVEPLFKGTDQSLLNAVNSALSYGQLENNTKATASQVNLNNEQANVAKGTLLNLAAQNDLTKAQAWRIRLLGKAELAQVMANTVATNSQAKLNNVNSAKAFKEIENITLRNIYQDLENSKQEVTKLPYDAGKSVVDYLKSHGPWDAIKSLFN